MSLNKWKTWPVEFPEDVLKINKKPCDHENKILWLLFDQNKNLRPQQSEGWTDPNFFLIDFDIWNVEIQVRMRKLDQFYELTPN